MIEDWPVQFLPVADDLDAEALRTANEVELQVPGERKVATRVLRAEHLVAIALRVGRPKDWARIHDFLRQKAVPLPLLKDVLARHNLLEKWNSFCERLGIDNPFRAG